MTGSERLHPIKYEERDSYVFIYSNRKRVNL